MLYWTSENRKQIDTRVILIYIYIIFFFIVTIIYRYRYTRRRCVNTIHGVIRRDESLQFHRNRIRAK